MKRAGRANWLTIAGTLGLLVIGVLFFLSGESSQSAAIRFMNALGKGDVVTLTSMSEIPGKSPDEIKSAWERTTSIGKHYIFTYKIESTLNANDQVSMVRMMVIRNAERDGGYEEKFELPLIKKDGKWKVEVLGLDRRLYPGLPRE
ncbi:MAG: DUF4878 domain-containing protein [Chthonomonas sp.]|nr:DUF4878 domain-containing protein [Chthonomonas sp.]